MKRFIEEKMDEIFHDFKDEINGMQTLCNLKILRFNGGIIPDYNQSYIQRLYLLRYFPAYLIEYYLMYDKLLDLNFTKLPLNILSIGSGCGLDYYGLVFALKNRGIDINDNVQYTGIDIINWGYKDNLGNPNCQYIQTDINNFQAILRNNYNIIVLPKSIGEFDTASFNQLLNTLERALFLEDDICILSSIREMHSEIDINRMNQIINVFRNKYYVCNNPNSSYYHFEEKQTLFAAFPDNFTFPSHIIDVLKELLCNCRNYIENGEPCLDDCKDLNRWPILRTDHMQFQIKILSFSAPF